MNITIIGAGKAGASFHGALRSVAQRATLLHHEDVSRIRQADLVLLCVPDSVVAEVSQSVPEGDYVVAHAAGALSLGVLSTHQRTGLMHPLAVLSSSDVGAKRLVGATYRVAGDRLIGEVVTALGGRSIYVGESESALYHATASVAANHLVALLAHVEVLARSAGLSLEDFLPLAQQALEDVSRIGTEGALTGPASRGDLATIDAHLAAIPDSQRSTYVTLANAAFELAERRRSSLSA